MTGVPVMPKGSRLPQGFAEAGTGVLTLRVQIGTPVRASRA
jgi:hypothetical protein